MKPTLADLRARMMKQGKVLPIWTPEEWKRIKEERDKPLDFEPFLNQFAQYKAVTRKLENTYGREVAKASES